MLFVASEMKDQNTGEKVKPTMIFYECVVFLNPVYYTLGLYSVVLAIICIGYGNIVLTKLIAEIWVLGDIATMKPNGPIILPDSRWTVSVKKWITIDAAESEISERSLLSKPGAYITHKAILVRTVQSESRVGYAEMRSGLLHSLRFFSFSNFQKSSAPTGSDSSDIT